MPMQLKLVVNGVISPNSPRDTVAPMENTYSYLQIHLISATHVTLNESDASESIT